MKKICTFLIFLVLFSELWAYQLIKSEFADSRLYPGTVREFIVSLPHGYDTITGKIGLYVGLDGILCNAPEVIDSLSAAGDIPPLIGVYVQPGVIKNDSGVVVRYNRSNEFDAVTPRFAKFLETELLPEVEKLKSPGGREIHIPEDPSRRMIFGLSSGGICAFNAAFLRPDLFGKVFTGCGTFVPMRGGEQLQALVRKAEPRPIKVFVQDGFTDTWNPLFGSWFEANTLLNSALEFAGYDVAHDWAEGGHSVRRANEIFAWVMKWMWSDDTPGPRTTDNATLSGILVEGEGWREAEPSQSCSISENPGKVEARYPDNSFIVRPLQGTNLLEQAILTPAGEEKFRQPFYYLHTAGAEEPFEISALQFDADGYLWALTGAGIQLLDHNGRVRGIISLPPDQQFTGMSISDDGKVTVCTADGRIFERRFNVSPAIPGITPKSQGQG